MVAPTQTEAVVIERVRQAAAAGEDAGRPALATVETGVREMADTSDRPWNATVRQRALVAAVLFALWGVAIEARLVYLQIYQHDALQVARAEPGQPHAPRSSRAAATSSIASGRTLALSVDAESICAVPSRIDDPAAVLDAVCWVLGDCTEKERQRVPASASRRRSRDFAYLRRKVTREVAEPGQGPGPARPSTPSPSRSGYYPNRELAAHVLGYLNLDNKGVSGIEQSFNSKVSGQPGRDAWSRSTPTSTRSAAWSARRCRATRSS